MARLFLHLNDHWNTSNSLIETFGTFCLLSYVKIVNTSFDILMPVQLHNISGEVVGHGLYSYYNGSLEYFGPQHINSLCCPSHFCIHHMHSISSHCCCFVPVDAFSPVLTVVDSTVRCCIPSWMLFKAAASLSHMTVDTGLPSVFS